MALRIAGISFIIITGFLCSLIQLSSGLRVSPPEFVVVVPVGARVNCTQILVLNDRGHPVDVGISASHPLALRGGYQPLPKLEWISFDTTGFRLEPGQQRYVTVYATIPNRPEYIGQKYEVWLDFSGDGFIVTMLSVRMLIDTAGPLPGPLELLAIWIWENLGLFLGIVACVAAAIILVVIFTKYLRIEVRRR